MLRSSLCDYSDAYILAKGAIIVTNTEAGAEAANNVNTKVILKNFAVFNNCISRINNTQVGDAHDFDVVMPMYNLAKFSDNYSKTSGILQQYCIDQPALANNGDITEFNEGNFTSSFDIKGKITGRTSNNGRKMLK